MKCPPQSLSTKFPVDYRSAGSHSKSEETNETPLKLMMGGGVLTILLGPFLALLPKRWRDSLPAFLSPEWRLATILSGLGESAIALFAMLEWYSYSVSTWVSRAMESASSGNLPREANEQEIGFAAITIFAMHPWTWVIGLVAIEGTVRLLGAAFSENNLGSFPLYLVDKLIARITGRVEPKTAGASAFAKNNASSFAEAMRQKMLQGRFLENPDEICMEQNGADEILEIRSRYMKENWEPPKVVRYGESYYRLEASATGTASRPFVYRLRRLAAGVPGRTVLIYQPAEAPIELKTQK